MIMWLASYSESFNLEFWRHFTVLDSSIAVEKINAHWPLFLSGMLYLQEYETRLW